MKKAIISGVVATIVGGGTLLGIERIFVSDDEYPQLQQSESHVPANINLVGSNNDLSVTSSEQGLAVLNANIIGSNIEREILLPKGQRLNIKINGSNNKLSIHKSIFSQVVISELGSNNKVSKSIW